MKKSIVILAMSVAAVGAQAAVIFNGTPYTQDFNTLSSVNATTVPWTDNSTIAGWYARRMDLDVNGNLINLTSQYLVGSGTTTTGTLYSFGQSAAPDRSLGSIGSNNNDANIFGVKLFNNTNTNYTSVTVTYDGEQWRNGGNTSFHSLLFSYSLTATNIGNDGLVAGPPIALVADSNYIPVSQLNFTGPVALATGGALDGNAAANRVAGINFTISNINWAPGVNLWLRWVDLNDPGNDHGLGIDNLSVSAVPEPGTMIALGVGALALLRRKKKIS